MTHVRRQCWLALSVISACLATATVDGQATPQNPLPAPTGPYAVGRTQFDWVDPSRADTANPGGHREIVVWVWYPAALRPAVKPKPTEWMPGKWGEFYWSDFLSRHADVLKKDT